MDIDERVGLIVLAALAFPFVFWIAREISLWYWKINRIVELLEKIEFRLKPESEKTAEGKVREEKAMGTADVIKGAYDV